MDFRLSRGPVLHLCLSVHHYVPARQVIPTVHGRIIISLFLWTVCRAERLQSAAQQWHIQLFSPLTVNVATSRQSAPNQTTAFITGNNVSPGSWSVVVYVVLICSNVHAQRRHTSKEGKFITKMNNVLFWKLWVTDLGAIFSLSQFCQVFNLFVFGAFAAFFIRYGVEYIKLLWREWGWNRDTLVRFKPKLLV